MRWTIKKKEIFHRIGFKYTFSQQYVPIQRIKLDKTKSKKPQNTIKRHLWKYQQVKNEQKYWMIFQQYLEHHQKNTKKTYNEVKMYQIFQIKLTLKNYKKMIQKKQYTCAYDEVI